MIANANLHPQYIKDTKGKTSFVILPISEYDELLEDLQDLAIISERRNESTISFYDLQKKLGMHADVQA